MSAAAFTLSVSTGDAGERVVSSAEMDAVRRGLIEFNRRYLRDSYNPLCVLARDGAGRVVGGLLGSLYWEMCAVDILWVEDGWRGRGVGTALVAAAEEAACAHGCRRIHLDTMSFQAPGFYGKLGYTVFGVLTGYPQDATRIYLVKDLAP